MTLHRKLSQARTYIEGFLGYTFTNVDLLEEVLWGMPVTMANGKKLIDGNKRLAMVGDAVLDLVIIQQPLDRGMTRSKTSKRLQSGVSNDALAELARAHGIAQFVISQTAMSPYMRATAVEAILGASVKDNGYNYDVLKRAVAAFGII